MVNFAITDSRDLNIFFEFAGQLSTETPFFRQNQQNFAQTLDIKVDFRCMIIY